MNHKKTALCLSNCYKHSVFCSSLCAWLLQTIKSIVFHCLFIHGLSFFHIKQSHPIRIIIDSSDLNYLYKKYGCYGNRTCLTCSNEKPCLENLHYCGPHFRKKKHKLIDIIFFLIATGPPGISRCPAQFTHPVPPSSSLLLGLCSPRSIWVMNNHKIEKYLEVGIIGPL